MIKLSPHFTLAELTRSDVAQRLDIDNTPSDVYQQNLVLLCTHILQPVRERFGPVFVSSGYRSLALNMAINRMTSTINKVSKHSLGQAADFECPGVSNYTLATWIRDNIPAFQQCILEFYTPGQPNSGWVHAAYVLGENKNECLTAVRVNGKTSYLKGLLE